MSSWRKPCSLKVTFLGLLGDDVVDVVTTVFTEDSNKVLGAFLSYARETFRVFALGVFWWLLAVTDHVDGGRCCDLFAGN